MGCVSARERLVLHSTMYNVWRFGLGGWCRCGKGVLLTNLGMVVVVSGLGSEGSGLEEGRVIGEGNESVLFVRGLDWT